MRISSIQYKFSNQNYNGYNNTGVNFSGKKGALRGAAIGFVAGIASFMPFAEYQSSEPDFHTTMMILCSSFMGAIIGDTYSGDNDKNLK